MYYLYNNFIKEHFNSHITGEETDIQMSQDLKTSLSHANVCANFFVKQLIFFFKKNTKVTKSEDVHKVKQSKALLIN